VSTVILWEDDWLRKYPLSTDIKPSIPSEDSGDINGYTIPKILLVSTEDQMMEVPLPGSRIDDSTLSVLEKLQLILSVTDIERDTSAQNS
jgi:hypothetical protein